MILSALMTGTVLTVSAGVYDVMDFGAKNDGKTLTTKEIQAAIDRCHEEGGGVVSVPSGQYLVGTLSLRSDVEFNLRRGAVLVVSAFFSLSPFTKH